jgi:hypothetical protein
MNTSLKTSKQIWSKNMIIPTIEVFEELIIMPQMAFYD